MKALQIVEFGFIGTEQTLQMFQVQSLVQSVLVNCYNKGQTLIVNQFDQNELFLDLAQDSAVAELSLAEIYSCLPTFSN